MPKKQAVSYYPAAGARYTGAQLDQQWTVIANHKRRGWGDPSLLNDEEEKSEPLDPVSAALATVDYPWSMRREDFERNLYSSVKDVYAAMEEPDRGGLSIVVGGTYEQYQQLKEAIGGLPPGRPPVKVTFVLPVADVKALQQAGRTAVMVPIIRRLNGGTPCTLR